MSKTNSINPKITILEQNKYHRSPITKLNSHNHIKKNREIGITEAENGAHESAAGGVAGEFQKANDGRTGRE